MADRDMSTRRGITKALAPAVEEQAPFHRRVTAPVKSAAIIGVGLTAAVVLGDAAVAEVARNAAELAQAVPYIAAAGGAATLTGATAGIMAASTHRPDGRYYGTKEHIFPAPRLRGAFRRVRISSGAVTLGTAAAAIGIGAMGLPAGHVIADVLGVASATAGGVTVAATATTALTRRNGRPQTVRAIGE